MTETQFKHKNQYSFLKYVDFWYGLLELFSKQGRIQKHIFGGVHSGITWEGVEIAPLAPSLPHATAATEKPVQLLGDPQIF